jgi:hypothetical protein
MNPKEVKQIADDHGWRFVGRWQDQPILEFKRMADKLLVNCEKRLVTTMVYHDKFKRRFGATRLMREDVSDELLKSIFDNPRAHTDKGRYLINN